LLLPHPGQYLSDALQFLELVEDKRDRVAHATIGILLDLVNIGFQITN
jgi:hypothetical protein